MTRLAGLLVVAATLGVLVVGPARTTSCIAWIEWRGQGYEGLGESAPAGISAGRRLGAGVVPPCGEATRGCSAPDPITRTVLEIDDVAPAIAVVVAEDFGVYAAPQYVGADPRHPLHEALYGPLWRKRERRNWICGSPADHRATAGAQSLVEPALLLDEDAGVARLESRTTFVGLDRNGVAYLEEGQRLLVDTLTCHTQRGRTKVVATRVEPLGGR